MHYTEGAIQAYVDGELGRDEAKRIKEHIYSCSNCKEIYDKLKANQDFAEDAFGRFDDIHVKGMAKIEKRRSFTDMLNKYKKGAIAAVLVTAVGISMTFPPVQAAAQSFLQIFRVNKVATVKVTEQDLSEIQNSLANLDGGSSTLDLDKFGALTADNISSTNQDMSMEEARGSVDFDIKEIKNLPFKAEATNPSVMKPGSMKFKLNTDEVNKFIKSLGGNALLPDDLNGKEFTVKLGGEVTMPYSGSDESDYLTLTEIASPEIGVPDGVDADSVRKTILQLPFIPQNIREQLSGIDDWEDTLPVPADDEHTKDININGKPGLLYLSDYDDYNYYNVVWADDGVIYNLNGNFKNEQEAIKTARSVR